MLNQYKPAKIDSFLIAWRPALVAAGLASLIVLYNAGLKRTLLGPIAMGGCRALNVLLGMSVIREPWRMEHGLVAAGVGIYIAGVTWFARNDAGRSQRWQLVAGALVMLAGVGVVAALPWLSKDMVRLWQLHPELRMPQLAQWGWLMVLLAGFVIARTAPAIAEPSRGPVRAAVGRSITALIFLDAAACYAGAGTMYAIVIAVLVLPTVLVSRWISAG
jgi:4-hydroxybenzoate polyprenyltransferase